MQTRYHILDSANGDALGAVDLGVEMPDEHVIEMLVSGGYLDPPSDEYLIDDAFPFSDDGERVIVNSEGEPMLTLTPREPEPADEDDDEDEDENDPDELNSEDVL